MPGLATLDDPEILALLDFEPVPRKRKAEDAWTPELQCEFIVRLAVTGSPGRAAEEMGKTDTGVRKLYRSPDGKSFRAAWDGAVALAKRRKALKGEAEEPVVPGSKPPSLDNRRKWPPFAEPSPSGEEGESEAAEAMARLAEQARDSFAEKLLRCRRLYLSEISSSPAKRAAFEILTDLPIDWDKAARGEAQADEPYRRINQHRPDMVLTAESGWSFGEGGYGPDKKAEQRQAIDQWRAERGKEPVRWDDDDDEGAGRHGVNP